MCNKYIQVCVCVCASMYQCVDVCMCVCIVVVRWVINCNMPLGSWQQMMTGTKYLQMHANIPGEATQCHALLDLPAAPPSPALLQLNLHSLFLFSAACLLFSFCSAPRAMKNSRTMRSMLIWPPKQQRKHKQMQSHTHRAKEVCHCVGVGVGVRESTSLCLQPCNAEQ